MKRRLSNRLSPSAKKAFLRGKPGELINGMLQVAANDKFEKLEPQLIELGVNIGVFNDQTNQLSLSVPVDSLEALVDLDGVVYFEASTPYFR
jgi:hypothetical protein